MSGAARFNKLWVAVVLGVGSWVGVALNDGTVSVEEWGLLVGELVTALGVYVTPNRGTPKA